MSKASSMLSLGLGSFVFYDQFVKYRLESQDSFGVFLNKLFTAPQTIKFKTNKEENNVLNEKTIEKKDNNDFLSTIKIMIPAGFPIFKIPIETILDNPRNTGLFLISAILFTKRKSIKKRASGLMYVTKNSFNKNIGSLKGKINQKFAQTSQSLKVLLRRVHLLKGEVKKTQEKVDNVKKDTDKLKTTTQETKTLTQHLYGLAKNVQTDTKNLQKQNGKIEKKVDDVRKIVKKNDSNIERIKQYLAPNIFEREESPKRGYKLGEKTGQSDEDVILNNSDAESEPDLSVNNGDSFSPNSSDSEVISTGEVVNTNDDGDSLHEEENGNDYASWFPILKLPSIP